MISDSTSFKLWTFNRDSVIFPFNRLTFYGQKLDVFDLRFDSSVVLTDTIYGPDYREFVFEELQDTLSMEMVRWDSTTTDTLVLQGMHFWNDRPGITYHALGVNGSSAETFLKCDFQGMQKIHPDLVIFGLGINDAYKTEEEFDTLKFKNNYLEIMRRIQEFNPDVEFLFLTNSDSYYKRKVPNKNAFAVSRMMMEIAQEEENTAYWDLFEIMGGLNSIKTWEEFDLAKRDKIHFKRPGYRLEAELLFDALIRDYNTEAKKQTSYTPVLE